MANLRSLNKVFLLGNLTRDPELKYTGTGMAVAKLGLAVNRRFKSKSGEWQEEATFIDVDVWGKSAENVAQFCKKGSGVFIEGSLRLDSWEKDGEKRSKLKVTADRVQFADDRKPDGAGGGVAGSAAGATDNVEEEPFH
ncbi:MAG TPA: single-stranded DNA-binding protein [bacterium]|nr:single-stranded DNA-binding protein [bacterium]